MARAEREGRDARDPAGFSGAGSAGGLRAVARRRPAGLDRRDDVRAALGCGSCAGEEVHDQNLGCREMRRVFGLLILMLVTLASARVPAHEMTMAEMELRESSPGEFLW